MIVNNFLFGQKKPFLLRPLCFPLQTNINCFTGLVIIHGYIQCPGNPTEGQHSPAIRNFRNCVHGDGCTVYQHDFTAFRYLDNFIALNQGGCLAIPQYIAGGYTQRNTSVPRRGDALTR